MGLGKKLNKAAKKATKTVSKASAVVAKTVNNPIVSTALTAMGVPPVVLDQVESIAKESGQLSQKANKYIDKADRYINKAASIFSGVKKSLKGLTVEDAVQQVINNGGYYKDYYDSLQLD